MATTLRGCALWSFLAATARGAGLMLLLSFALVLCAGRAALSPPCTPPRCSARGWMAWFVYRRLGLRAIARA